ncbi:MAG: phosphate ABC transporter substrate-binding protein [Vicinamibacterales bacterium]|nr:phosphate ABC transporter substrate-binding protein [Vicinamibacterales bacterium]
MLLTRGGVGLARGLMLLVTGLSLAGCAGGGRTTETRLVITGSSTIAPLAAEIARRFEAGHPGIRVDVQSGGSAQGLADVRRGTADIGMVSRALTPAEHDLRGEAIALDGIALIVHRDNPVTTIRSADVRAMATGQVTNWQALGGRPGAVSFVSKAEGRSTLELFLAHFDLPRDRLRPQVVIGDNLHAVRTVAGDPQAIAYVSIGTALVERDHGAPIALLALDDVDPTLANVRQGRFPIVRPLTLVTRQARTLLADAFLAFATSPAVRDLVEAQAFVPLD